MGRGGGTTAAAGTKRRRKVSVPDPGRLKPETAEDLAVALREVRAAEPSVGTGGANPDRVSTSGAELPASAPRLLALCGEPRSGKDHLAEYVAGNYRGVCVMAYSTAIISEVNDYLAENIPGHRIGESNKPLPHYRHLLQAWGLARREEDRDYWTKRLATEIDERLARDDIRTLFVSGARVETDLEPIHARGGELWRVERPDNDYSAAHAVESKISQLPADRVIENPGIEVPGAYERAIETEIGT